ncbi:glycine betaine/L-proline ABC transporter ATP-binding protein [Chloroflexota bacterium]
MIIDDIASDVEVSLKVVGLWKIFGYNSKQILNSEIRSTSGEAVREERDSMVALRDVSFEINRAELFVVMGLPGSGKSTLTRCILRLIEPTAGRIIIDGEDICTYTRHQLKDLRRYRMGLVLQHFGLFPHHNVIDNVAYGLKIRGVSREERYTRARETIKLLGLQEWESHLPSALNDGMQQRVGIARALTNNPDTLLMDEPFSGMDPLLRRQMQDKLLELQTELQKTILFMTQDLDEALKLGDRIAIIKDGEIIQIGTPEEVITSPSDAYVRDFVQDASPARVVTAGSIMEQPRVLLYEWQGPKVAMHALVTNKLDSAFLVNRTGKLLGLVTVEQLIALFRKKGKSIMEALEPDLLTSPGDTVVEDLVPLAASTAYPIAVVDDTGKFMGEIDTNSILFSMIQEREPGDEEADNARKETGEKEA